MQMRPQFPATTLPHFSQAFAAGRVQPHRRWFPPDPGHPVKPPQPHAAISGGLQVEGVRGVHQTMMEADREYLTSDRFASTSEREQ